MGKKRGKADREEMVQSSSPEIRLLNALGFSGPGSKDEVLRLSFYGYYYF